ncbi:hypothetical protein [Streptomyces sp. NPDC127033]|uniref:hypothetical protein n=1 Tax=Streptomyces sp. NPDC127033 TaxID=3347110 RepID=UPI0036634E40
MPAPNETTNLPAPANPDFVDRVEPLARLEAALDEAALDEAALDEGGPVVPPVVLGLGGTARAPWPRRRPTGYGAGSTPCGGSVRTPTPASPTGSPTSPSGSPLSRSSMS